MFEGMTKNLLFSLFMGVFISYGPLFWGSRVIYMFENYDQNLVVFMFCGRLHELFPTVLAFQGDLHV